MPWRIERRDGRYCVIKTDDGRNQGCHDSRADAIKQQRALYANESRRASMSAESSVGDQPFNPLWYYVGTSPPNNFVAQGGYAWPQWPPTVISDRTSPALTAAVAPLKPPREWFEIPEPDEVTPMTYAEDGAVFGHLAPWDTCHAGLASGAFSECVVAPKSPSDYSRFHLGEIETAEGDRIAVGKIVLATGHAPMTADLSQATKHYDDTGSVGAFVRARNGRHGIWATGAVRSDLSPEQLRDLRANPVSGDWRAHNGALELVAALAVPVPGFPIPRSQLALSASGAISALILTEIEEEDDGRASKAYLRRKAALSRTWQS